MNDCKKTAVEVPESLIQGGIGLLESDIDTIDSKLENMWDKLQPILGPPPEKPKGEDTVNPDQSPMLNHLNMLHKKTGKIITGLDNLLQRIQC